MFKYSLLSFFLLASLSASIVNAFPPIKNAVVASSQASCDFPPID